MTYNPNTYPTAKAQRVYRKLFLCQKINFAKIRLSEPMERSQAYYKTMKNIAQKEALFINILPDKVIQSPSKTDI